MASASNAEIDEFLNGALVSWLESCLPMPEILSGYKSLLDASIIHNVFKQIDPDPGYDPNDLTGLEGMALLSVRARNFESVIKNLKTLYEAEFRQTLLVLPDSYMLGYHPDSREGLEQMKILLTLLLGAAVQCPNKEIFIDRIKHFDINIQQDIVDLIKEVTDNHNLVLPQLSVHLPAESMHKHIIRLAQERDDFHFKFIKSVTAEQDTNMGVSSESIQNSPLSPISGTISTSSTESNHLAVELADQKSKIRKLRQELEEKSEAYLEVKEELDHKNNQYEKLRSESQEWYIEARRAATYRDEVDILRERAERADQLEVQVQKLSERLTDAEFYKARVEELRQDIRTLEETRNMLEDQINRSRKQSETVVILQSEILKYKQELNDMILERDADKAKLQELLEENTQLQLVAKNLNSTHEFERSVSDNEDECNSGDNSLSEQLTNNAQTRALKLELENRRLMAALEQIKETSFHESANKILELEKDKTKFSIKVEQLQESVNRLTCQNKELEDIFKNALKENQKLQDSLDLRQKANERQSQERELEKQKLQDLEKDIDNLNKEKQRIQNLNNSIQRRADDLERQLEFKAKEIDTLTTRTNNLDEIKNKNYEIESKLSTMERENCSLLKEITKLKENLELKSVQYDTSTSQSENYLKEIHQLKKDVSDMKGNAKKIQDLDKINVQLESQRKIDLETISTLQMDLINGTLASNKFKNNLEKLGIDNTEMENSEAIVETVVEKLIKNPETFKTVREIMLNTTKEQNTKSHMCVLCQRKEIFTVERNIEFSCDEDLNIEEPQKLRSQIDSLHNANSVLQNSNEMIQAENARLNVDNSKLGSQITSLNTQQVALQLANSQLAADKDVLLKQIDAIKQEHRNVLHDQATLQDLHNQLNLEYESLNNDKEILRATTRDLKNENRDFKEKSSSQEKLIEELKSQIASLKSTSDDLNILRSEHSKLTDDFRNLFATNDRFKNEYKNIQEQYKMIRAENSRFKLQNTELSGELNLRSDQVKMLEIDFSKISQRCEMLQHQNSNLDIDRRTLMDNVSQLLTQYHELLTHSLEDKQHYHDEEKNFTDKVNSLNRQKEKLEEKIMETYKKSESCAPKKKAFGSSFVKRVKKASSDLMNKVPSRNRRSWIEDSRITQSQFAGSESGGNDSDNSEEPSSMASESQAIQRNIPHRQSLQRIFNENGDSSSLSRGGTRNSLQLHKRNDNSRRNSVHGLEAPDVTGSSLTLGAAGSRRTVYLVDENQKLSETQMSNTTQNESQTPSRKKNDSPSTFLMYNRINTTVITGTSPTNSRNPDRCETSSNVCDGNEVLELDQKKRTPEENSIWYEYGCV